MDPDSSQEDHEVPEYYTTEDGLNALAKFLRNSKGIKTREGKVITIMSMP